MSEICRPMTQFRKLWRNSSRRVFSYILLFFLGVLTCLFSLQILQLSTTDLDDSPVYYSFSDKDPPCEPLPPGETVNSNSKTPKRRELDLPDPGANYYEEVLSVDRHDILNPPSKEQHDQDGFHSIRTSINRFQRTNRRRSQDASRPSGSDTAGPTLWVVTPTFYRPEQKPELTRLAQALLPVSHFVHWIVVDDISQGSDRSLKELQSFLERFPLSFTLLKSLPPSDMKIVGKPRGVGGRRAAIAWLRQYAKEGVVYFGDDDNTYDSDIFLQVRIGSQHFDS